MRPLRWFLLGAVAVLVLEIAAAGVVLMSAHGWSARAKPTPSERWLARATRHAAMSPGAKALTNPIPNTPAVLAEARAHWADHCAVCHANDGSGEVPMGGHMYPPAPDMRAPLTQDLSDGELFSIIQNGVRLTGMPAWGGGRSSEEDSWKLVHFIRHLPHLTIEEKLEMEKLNPKGPEDRKEEEEEEKFLKGESAAEPQPHHHH
jgi:mono/diheme cytochrome c family protein